MSSFLHPFFSSSPYRNHRQGLYNTLTINLSLSLAVCISLSVMSSLAQAEPLPISSKALQVYHDAQKAEAEGRLERALVLYSYASQQAPNDALIHLHVGNTLKAMQRYSEALVHYQQAYKLAPHDAAILLNIGLTLEQLNEPQLAENALLALQKKQPRFTYIEFHLARLAQLQNKPEQAIDHYTQFLMAYPNHYDAKRALAKLYVTQKQPEQAIALFNSMQRQSPDSFSDHLALAKAYNLNQSPEQALNVLQTLVNQSDTPPHADVSAEMGFAHLALGQAGFAIHHFERAAHQHPEDPNIRLGLSRTYLELHQPEQAIPHLTYYLSQYPDDLPVKMNLAQAYVEAEQFDHALSTQNSLLKALSVQPQTPQTQQAQVDLRQQKGLTQHRLGQLDQAISTYTALLNQQSIQPYLTAESRANTLQNLALAHHQLGHIDKALNLYQTAYSNTPTPSPKLKDDMARAWLTKANQAIQVKQFDQATFAIAQARDIASENFTDTQAVEANLWAEQYHAFAEKHRVSTGTPNPTVIQQMDSLYQKAEKALLTAHKRSPNNTDINLQLAHLYLNAPVSVADATVHAKVKKTLTTKKEQTAAPNISKKAIKKITETVTSIPPATQADFYLNQALTHDPDNLQALQLKAQWLINQQQPEQALTLFQQYWDSAKTSKPSSYKAELAYEYANLFRQLNQPEQAITWYQQATAQAPHYKEAYYNQAVVFGQEGKHTAAKHAYEKALETDPNFAEALYGIAVTDDFLGDTLKAQYNYQKYLDTHHALYATAASERLSELQPTPKAPSSSDLTATEGQPQHPPETQRTQQATKSPPITVTQPEQAKTTLPTLNPGKTTLHIGGKHPVNIHLNIDKVSTNSSAPSTPASAAQPLSTEPLSTEPLSTLYRAE